jgi:hypothetical protein
MVTRRAFFSSLASAISFFFAACVTRDGREDPGPAREIEPHPPAMLTRVTFAFAPVVPRLMFFPECKLSPNRASEVCKAKQISVTAMEIEGPNLADFDGLKVKVFFSNGQNRTLKGNAGSSYRVVNGKQMCDRGGVLIKSMVSSVVDAVFNSLRSSKFGTSRNATRLDFQRLQESGYLDSISIGAIFHLAAEVSQRTNLQGVTFSKERARFVVS